MARAPDPGDVVRIRIKEMRSEAGLRQQDLGERLSDLGWGHSATNLGHIESGRKKNLSVNELVALAVALSVGPTALLAPRTGPLDDPVALTEKAQTTAARYREWVLFGGALRSYDLDEIDRDGKQMFRMWTIDGVPEDDELMNHRLAGRKARHTDDELRTIAEVPAVEAIESLGRGLLRTISDELYEAERHPDALGVDEYISSAIEDLERVRREVRQAKARMQRSRQQEA